MLKKVIALTTVSPLHIGGAEHNMLQIAWHLKDRFKIIIVGPMSLAFKDKINNLGIKGIEIPMGSKFSLITIVRLISVFLKEKVQIVHTHDTRGGLLGRIAARIAGTKVVHTVHMPAFFQTSQLLKQWFYNKIERFLNHKFTDKVIFVSENIKDACLKKGLCPISKAYYVPNGIQLNQLRNVYNNKQLYREKLNDKIGVSNGNIIACWAGRISRQKGLDVLIEAIKRLRRKDFKCLIIGDGTDRAEIEFFVHQQRLEDHVIFTGFLNQDEVYQYLCASDFFVFPSRYECLPYAIIEAMAVGLPCIVSDVGGNIELVKDGYNGYVVPSEDSVALTDAIRRVLDSEEIRREFGENSFKLAQQYDELNMIIKVEALYKSLFVKK